MEKRKRNSLININIGASFSFICAFVFFISIFHTPLAAGEKSGRQRNSKNLGIPGHVTVRILSLGGIGEISVRSEGMTIRSGREALHANQALIRIIPGSGNLEIDLQGKKLKVPSPVTLESREPVRISCSGIESRPYETPIFIRNTGKQLFLTTRITFERYIAGVVWGEMPMGDAAALRAQAVAARSYALKNREKHRDQGCDYCDTTHCQFYRGWAGKGSPFYHAAMDTRGLVLMKDGQPVEGLFHSACGGYTSNPVDVYGEVSMGVTGIEDKIKGEKDFLCSSSPHFRWKFSIKKDKLERILLREPGYGGLGSIKKIRVDKRDRAGRVLKMAIIGDRGKKITSGYDFWQTLGSHIGWGKIKSSWFYVSDGDGYFHFRGRGLGHGLGMCQWGAMKMAEKGYNFREILKLYFPGARVEKFR